MSKFQNHFSPRKKSFFDPIFFLVKNMYLDFTIKAVRKRFAQMVHFRSTNTAQPLEIWIWQVLYNAVFICPKNM